MGISRTYSNQFVKPGRVDSTRNLNSEWLNNPQVAVAYLLGIVISKMVLQALTMEGFGEGLQWLAVNAVHTLVTYGFVHHTKGSPDDFSQGDFAGQTLWEQMDGGLPYTAKKKFLMLVPTLLFLIASYASDFRLDYLFVNLLCFAFCIVPKLHAMHGVRVLGINRTPGIDDGSPKKD